MIGLGEASVKDGGGSVDVLRLNGRLDVVGGEVSKLEGKGREVADVGEGC